MSEVINLQWNRWSDTNEKKHSQALQDLYYTLKPAVNLKIISRKLSLKIARFKTTLVNRLMVPSIAWVARRLQTLYYVCHSHLFVKNPLFGEELSFALF